MRAGLGREAYMDGLAATEAVGREGAGLWRTCAIVVAAPDVQ
jgi:hypothetical protein